MERNVHAVILSTFALSGFACFWHAALWPLSFAGSWWIWCAAAMTTITWSMFGALTWRMWIAAVPIAVGWLLFRDYGLFYVMLFAGTLVFGLLTRVLMHNGDWHTPAASP